MKIYTHESILPLALPLHTDQCFVTYQTAQNVRLSISTFFLFMNVSIIRPWSQEMLKGKIIVNGATKSYFPLQSKFILWMGWNQSCCSFYLSDQICCWLLTTKTIISNRPTDYAMVVSVTRNTRSCWLSLKFRQCFDNQLVKIIKSGCTNFD